MVLRFCFWLSAIVHWPAAQCPLENDLRASEMTGTL